MSDDPGVTSTTDEGTYWTDPSWDGGPVFEGADSTVWYDADGEQHCEAN